MPLSVKHTAIDPTKSIALGTSNITQAEVNVALREIKSQKKRQATRAKNRAKRKRK